MIVVAQPVAVDAAFRGERDFAVAHISDSVVARIAQCGVPD